MEGSLRGPFLNTGVIHVIVQSLGSSPVDTDCLNISVSEGAKGLDRVFRMRAGIWSVPGALLGFSPASNFSTPFTVIVYNGVTACAEHWEGLSLQFLGDR